MIVSSLRKEKVGGRHRVVGRLCELQKQGAHSFWVSLHTHPPANASLDSFMPEPLLLLGQYIFNSLAGLFGH